VEQVWELAHAPEQRVQLPPVNVPDLTTTTNTSGGELQGDPAAAAWAPRAHWGLGQRIPHLVRTMETRGIIVTTTPFAGGGTARVDAFSTSHLPRPLVVLTPDRADDVCRHRFTAAHELGHLLLHRNTAPRDPQQEHEANLFAAELLTPATLINAPRCDWLRN